MSLSDGEIRALIADLREYAIALRASVHVHHTGADLIEQAADALSALTVPDGDARERLIDVLVMTDLSDYAGTDMGMINAAADAILAEFPVLSSLPLEEIVTDPCPATTPASMHFHPDDPSSIHCTRRGTHDEHGDSNTGLTWREPLPKGGETE